MRKYILTLLTVFLLSTCTTAFAGRNVITNFKGTIKSVVLIAQDNTEYTVLSGSTDFNHTSTFNLQVEAGPGKTIPYGDYKGIKCVFANNFEVTGYVELTNSGADNGIYYTTGALSSGKPTFEKNGSPTALTYKYANGTYNWGSYTAAADATDVTMTDSTTSFSISESTGKGVNITVVVEYLWFGPPGVSWTNFNETDYVNGVDAGETFTLAGTTLTAPFLDIPEPDVN